MTIDRPVPPGLQRYWNSPVAQFAQMECNDFEPWEKERHSIFSELLFGLIYDKWNGNKYGPLGDYGNWRSGQLIGKCDGEGVSIYEGGTYLGHNIAALAVDREGRVIDFDFNHNAVFDSTVEHAESRLVRRLFALNQIYDPWYALEREAPALRAEILHAERPRQRRSVFATAASDRSVPLRTGSYPMIQNDAVPQAPQEYSTLLKDVTIYTSLESCAQCSGIMCLASVKDVVYLQWDQGQFLIGNMMRKATAGQGAGFVSPRPIRGDEFGFQYFNDLNRLSEEFSRNVKYEPFYEGVDRITGQDIRITSGSVTSFLCTDEARNVFSRAHADLMNRSHAEFPDAKPADVPNAFTNEQVLIQARDYLSWVKMLNNRGAAHRV
ncbi:hypothetical protein [Nocardia aurantiaca]|uniref:Uncharacterized protein n=1 Tax=Nocardia aurantiaca TaxID=2675850 RepID=A0A6I3L8U6_9NOCA|nr:hypothetical protein [Nocardia aurantiaca]MTE16666.1 hypothetical protein [Nocardia aurantiaca]